MDLIWNKENFSQDFKKYLGFVDADIRFTRLHSALRASTKEVVDLIGEDAYNTVKGDNEESNPLTELVKYAILLRALIIYIPTADIAITNRGRKNRTDEQDGTPWQWMLEANDKALISLYYRHLDLLLQHMIDKDLAINIAKYNYKDLLVNGLNKFEQYFNINGSYYLYIKLLPALHEFEELELAPRIQNLEASMFDNSLKSLAAKASVFYALDWGVRRLNAQLFPEGFFKEDSPKIKGGSGGTGQRYYLESAMLFNQDWMRYVGLLESKVQKKLKKEDPNQDRIVIDIGIKGDDGFIDT